MGGKTRGFYAAVFVSGSYVRVMIQTGAVNSGSSLNAYLELPHSELSKIEPSVSTRSKAPKPRRQCGRRRHSALITSSTTTSIHIRALTFNGRRGLYRVIVIVRQHFADNDRFIDLYFFAQILIWSDRLQQQNRQYRQKAVRTHLSGR